MDHVIKVSRIGYVFKNFYLFEDILYYLKDIDVNMFKIDFKEERMTKMVDNNNYFNLKS